MKLFRGTPVKDPLILKGSFVTPFFPRAANYARYPDNGDGNALGYVYELDVDYVDVEWCERTDIEQGKLKRDVHALRYTISDIPINVLDRNSPIRIRPDDSCVWNGPPDKREIIWLPLATDSVAEVEREKAK